MWTGKASSFLTLLVSGLVMYEVILRHFFHLPTLWGNESTIFGCAVLYVLGGAWTLSEDVHVRIDLVYGKLSTRQKSIIDAVTYLFFALYMIMLFFASAKYAWKSFLVREGTSSPWNPPIYPIKIALVIGVFLLFLQGSVKFIRDLYFSLTGKKI
jgi:TRAP-type mannitol/chloroaromatic compound transport system permease small subunit